MPESLARGLLAVVVAGLVCAAFFPFRVAYRGPLAQDNGAVQRADGSLALRPPALARTPTSPEWVAEAREAGALAVEVECVPATADQRGPARILSLSSGPRTRNLLVGQEGDDLVVRARRPGADANGRPGVVVPDVFAAGGWRVVRVDVGDDLRVSVDDVVLHDESFGENALAGWDPALPLVLGDETTGGRPWAGTIRRATVRAGGRTHDLLAAGALELPERFWRVPDLALRMLRPDDGDFALTLGLHVLLFAPLGFALVLARGGRFDALRVVAVALSLSVALELGKLFFDARHPTLLHVFPDLAGALLGALLARTLLARAAATDRCAA